MNQYQGTDIEMEIARVCDEIMELRRFGEPYQAVKALKLERAKEKLRQLELQKAREKEVKGE